MVSFRSRAGSRSLQAGSRRGIFGGGFQDVTALSHETSEAIDDPFNHNPTPHWQFPGQPANRRRARPVWRRVIRSRAWPTRRRPYR
jgi:hypothetical protein